MKKCVSVLLSFLLVMSLCSCDTSFITKSIEKLDELTSRLSFTYTVVETESDAASLEPAQVGENAEYIFCYPCLTKKQQEIYRIFLTAAEEMPKNFINLGSKTDSTVNDITVSYRAMMYDHPEIFWMPYTYIIGYKKNGNKTDLLVAFDYHDNEHSSKYLVSENQRNAKRDNLNNLINIIVGYSKDYKSVYEKVRFLNDFICDNTEYDKENTFAHTSYGCIISGKAVCEGYSKAFQMLCAACGIKCEPVCGISENEEHMWNCVNIDGQWSYTDVTWNDVGEEALRYAYLNISEGQLLFDHMPAPLLKDASEKTVQDGGMFNFSKHKCSNIKNTFYAKTDALMDSSFSNAAKVIANNALFGEKSISLMFSDDKAKKKFEADNDAAISAIQRRLFTVELKSYSVTRDIVVFYWN